MDDLVVDNELTATVVDDESADRATAISEGLADAAEEGALGDDGQTLLDVTGLGHGSEGGVVVDVEDTVGLEDGTEHGLDNNGGGGVRDEARLLLELAGEQVDTEVTVLAGLGRDRDADHLAGAALKDQDVADANEVAGDGDGLAGSTAVAGLDDTDILTGSWGWRALVVNNFLVAVVERVQQVIGRTLNATAEGVVLTLVVVVTHLASRGGVTDCSSLGNLGLGRSVARSLSDVDLGASVGFAAVRAGRLLGVSAVVREVGDRSLRLGLVYGLLVATVVRDVDVVGGRGPATVVSLSDVELGLNNGLIVNLVRLVVTSRRLVVVAIEEGKSQLSGGCSTKR